jgi:RF-1 domain
MTHPAELMEQALLDACDVRRQRRSGPGGQHRNKVETGIFLTHRDSGIQGSATERRSQAENLQVAIQRLRVELAIGVRMPRGDTPSSELWARYCLSRRIQINPANRDYPSVLAEALDTLAQRDWNVPLAAQHLHCGNSQLVALVASSPRAFELLNRKRKDRGLRPLAKRR